MPDHNGFPDDVAIANVIVSEAPWTGHRLAVSLAAKKVAERDSLSLYFNSMR